MFHKGPKAWWYLDAFEQISEQTAQIGQPNTQPTTVGLFQTAGVAKTLSYFALRGRRV